jgi:hypothetical protein
MDQALIPLTDEQSKAIQEVAKTTGIAFETLQKLGGFLRQAMGRMPENLFGYLGGDWLAGQRLLNLIAIEEKVQKRLEGRGVKDSEPVSLVLAKPIIQDAADESRAELQDLWARLIANAMDPKTAEKVRKEFINAIKEFHPIDAAILEKIYIATGELKPNAQQFLSATFGISTDAVIVSFLNLERAGCLGKTNLGVYVILPFGKELMKACAA